MTILEALKTKNLKIRYNGRWLVFDNGMWEVWRDKNRLPFRIYQGDDEQEAVRVLLED